MLEAGADPTVKNSENETAIEVAAPTLKRKMKVARDIMINTTGENIEKILEIEKISGIPGKGQILGIIGIIEKEMVETEIMKVLGLHTKKETEILEVH